MGGYALPVKTIREMICGSIDVIVQASRFATGRAKSPTSPKFRDGRRDRHAPEHSRLRVTAKTRTASWSAATASTGIARPRFWDRAEYYKEEGRLATALAASEVLDVHGKPLGESHA